ncbi:MAG: DNA polymerase III subunit delta' [Desulfobacteraceae bacterium 4572_130]|nr:MAG: DNA polymerase III subunit delta' [Desulfobacteraceae bacterium 4572_130]
MSVNITETMYDFSHIQEKVYFTLKNIIEKRKIPNALLFTGNKGTGKQTAAMLFAQTINCYLKKNSLTKKSCDKCKSCKKIISGMHPDIILISPQKEKILIEQIRGLYSFVSGRPHEAKMRMILIIDADKMNNQASNALLKILEEPFEKTFFILLAEKLTKLIPTIISRCRHIRFMPISYKNIKHILINDYNINKKLASITALASQSNLKKALMLVNKSQNKEAIDWIKRREWLIKEISSIIVKKNISDRLKALPLSEKLSREPELLKDSILIIRTWFRDIAIFRFIPDHVINSDFKKILKNINENISVQDAITWLKELHKVEKKIDSNAIIRLTLEHFFLKITI